MPQADRHKIMLCMFLWHREVQLQEEVEERRQACRLVEHLPEDLHRLYMAEQKFKDFKELSSRITEILDLW